MVNKNEVKRSYYLNLFSGNADITTNIGEQFSSTGQQQTFITGTTLTSKGDGYTEAPIVKVPELNYYDSSGNLNNLATITSNGFTQTVSLLENRYGLVVLNETQSITSTFRDLPIVNLTSVENLTTINVLNVGNQFKFSFNQDSSFNIF